MMRLIVKCVVVMLSLALCVGCSSMRLTSNPLSEAGMREILIEKGDVIVQFTVNGVAEAETTKARASLAGVVSAVYTSPGQLVEEGQSLAKLEEYEHKARLDGALLKLAEAQFRLDKAADTYAVHLEAEGNRVESLRQQLRTQEVQYFAMLEVPEAYSKHELELKQLSYEAALGSFEAARKNYETLQNNKDFNRAEQMALQAAWAEVRTAERLLERTTITSPMAGVLAQFGLTVGSVVNANQEIGAVIAQGVSKVSASIIELDLPQVFLGQEVIVTFAALPEEELQGQVVGIDTLPATSSGFANFKVNIELANANPRIRSGMTCAVDFVLEQALDVVYAPSQAIIELDEKFYVQMKGADNTLGLRQVKKGLDDGRRVQILDGLIPGEKIMIKLPTK